MRTSWSNRATTLLGNVRGLGYILIALFVALALDAWKARPDAVTLAIEQGFLRM